MVSVVYMVAGMSSRFGGKIKQFSRVGLNGETLMEVSMGQAIKAGFDKIIFIVGNMTEIPFKEMFGNNYKGTPIFYAKQTFNSEERDKPWGTCDAVISAKNLIKEDFVVCNGDDIYGEGAFLDCINFSKKENSECAAIGYLLGNVVPDNGSVNRGIFSKDSEGYLTGIKETLNIEKSKFAEMGLTKDNLTSQNIFFLRKEAVQMLEEKFTKFKESHKGDRKSECYLPTELSNLIDEKKIKIKLLMTDEPWFGVTNPQDEEIVKAQLKEYYSNKKN